VTIERPHSTEIEALALARRSGWPEDLRVLLTCYPREQWDGHPNLGGMARFWLSRHAMFRELSATIESITIKFQAGQLSPTEFVRQFVPRLQFMLDPALLKGLTRHLDDEEDLIVPLILDRGEEALGVGHHNE
jgi:hypothetical protein